MVAAASSPTVVIARERWIDAWPEIEPLSFAHHAEVAWPGEAPPCAVPAVFAAAEEQGRLVCFTLRLDLELIGYAWFWIYEDPQHAGERRATADALYLRPDCRLGTTGTRFLAACCDALTAGGIRVILIGVRAGRDFGPVLQRLGFAPTETTYARRSA